MSVAKLRVFASDEEILAAARKDAEERGVRYRRDRGENMVTLYNHFRKLQAAGGNGEMTYTQIARKLWPDAAVDDHKAECKQHSIQRWVATLERQGLIDCRPVRSRGQSGKFLRLIVELLPVPDHLVDITCATTRLRLPGAPTEGRVRPYCPRGGRRAPFRFKRSGGQHFFSPKLIAQSNAEGGMAPRGLLPPSANNIDLSAHEGAPRPTRSGLPAQPAPRRDGATGDTSIVAALDGDQRPLPGVVASSTLQAAETAFETWLGSPATGRLRNPQTARRLLWVLGRLDRYADFGVGRQGAGLEFLEQLFELGTELKATGEVTAEPLSLAYFIPGLEQTARRWKHTWAPRIKQQRREAQGRSTRPTRGKVADGPDNDTRSAGAGSSEPHISYRRRDR